MPYSGLRKHYVCGRYVDKSLLEPDEGPVDLICIMDTKERIVAQVTKSNYQIIDHDHSGIAGKHNQGGQSAARFERQRAELVKQWLKQTADIINSRLYAGAVTGDIVVAGPAQTKERMAEYINPVHHKSIIFRSAEYCNVAGIIQMMQKR